MQVKSKKKERELTRSFYTVTKHKGGTFEILLLHILVILSNNWEVVGANKGFELSLLLPKVDVEGVAPSLTISQVSTKLNALNYFTPQKLNKIKV